MTRFDIINKTVYKPCSPLHIGENWTLLDIVVLPEAGSTNDCVKETDYINEHNKKSGAINNVTFSPM